MIDSTEGKGDVRAGQAPAALLDDLKRRSGHIYEFIGGRANLIRSTVHR
ncbi:hypothetical protein [Allokutzneria multivorans]